MLNKIREWEAGRVSRAKKAVQHLFSQAEAQLEEADPEAEAQLGEADAEAMQEERAEAPAAADAE